MKTLALLLAILFMPGFLYTQSTLPSYYAQKDFLMASPGAMGNGLYGVDNPALLNYMKKPDAAFAWTDQNGKWNDFNKWGLFTAIPHLGFSVIRESMPDGAGKMTDYNLSAGFGGRVIGFGFGYNWITATGNVKGISNHWTLGGLIRPFRNVSVGMTGRFATGGGSREGVFDVGLRPFGNEWLTLFGDYAVQNKKPLGYDKTGWSAGAVAEVLPGVRFTARYFDSKVVTAGVQFSFGNAGVSVQGVTDRDRKYSHNTYAVRLGAYDRNIFRSHVFRKKQYVRYTLNTEIKHRRFMLFDKSVTLINLIREIDHAKNDPMVSGIAMNISGIEINREMAWELREKLLDFKSTGKHVIIYIDIAGMTEYHFASVADKIVMDPMGMVMVQGYVAGRTFMKGMLEKIGVGYDEWRFFKYKSAAEVLSRDSMSEGDREQRKAILDDQYTLVKSDVCKSRSVSEEKFDQWVNNRAAFLAKDAKEEGLVDVLGRWDEVEKIAEELEGKKQSFIQAKMITESRLPVDNQWGEDPGIAVVYALGACAMDEGIKGRTLSKVIEQIAKNRRIKAVVIRVDSPGGDALASDLVAEAMRTCRKSKPVIVSQGQVAGSGGYWLSMYGDTIVAAPNTVTGSIGVIGGWMYNTGLKEKLGLSTDHVKTGKHADLEFGMTLPLIGGGLPDRNLTEDERIRMEYLIKSLYRDFVQKVADGRKKSFESIEAVAQGRVFSGTDGLANGLVDALGGLDKAIDIAKERAGIPKDRKVMIMQYPQPDLFDPNVFTPKLFGIKFRTDNKLNELKFRLDNNGRPLPMMPLDSEWDQIK